MGGGQGGGGPGGGGPGGQGKPGPGGSPPKMREIKPVKREKFDKIVAEMFHEADTNRDGLATLVEVRGIANARRDVLIGKRFEKIDANGDRLLSRDEFFAWQRELGSVAQSEESLAIGRGIIPEMIEPSLGSEADARILAGIIEPLSAGLIAKANLDYDAGLSLAELLAYEGKRFDEADRDANGMLTPGEAGGPGGAPRRGQMGGPPNMPPPNFSRPSKSADETEE
jgi:hypothetical protein